MGRRVTLPEFSYSNPFRPFDGTDLDQVRANSLGSDHLTHRWCKDDHHHRHEGNE
jgi:hypothetical protein